MVWIFVHSKDKLSVMRYVSYIQKPGISANKKQKFTMDTHWVTEIILEGNRAQEWRAWILMGKLSFGLWNQTAGKKGFLWANSTWTSLAITEMADVYESNDNKEENTTPPISTPWQMKHRKCLASQEGHGIFEVCDIFRGPICFIWQWLYP